MRKPGGGYEICSVMTATPAGVRTGGQSLVPGVAGFPARTAARARREASDERDTRATATVSGARHFTGFPPLSSGVARTADAMCGVCGSRIRQECWDGGDHRLLLTGDVKYR
jgi:hypothetical protein